MLFSSIVFMNRTLRGQWLSVVFVFALQLNIVSNSQIQHDNVVKFSGDFEGFLKDLGSLVYKKKGVMNGNSLRSKHDHAHTTTPHKSYRRNQNVYNTQKSALGDVLMMKLVSYYEDKYKLTHFEPTTTETITFMDTFTNIANKYDVDPIDGVDAESTDYNQPQSTSTTDSTTMGPSPLMRRQMEVEEDPIPEVVIL